MTASRDQLTGCVIGLAVGDALGSPYEGLLADMIYDFGPADEIVCHRSRKPLYYTDDTQMTISVLETLVELHRMDEEELARRFAENYHPDRGYGQGARKIINAIGFGEDWREVARTIFHGEGSLGNGAAMRVAPIGVLFADDLDRVIREAEVSASPTHYHEIGVDGARLMAIAAALATRSQGRPLVRNEFLRELLPFAETEEFQWQINLAMELEPYQSLVSFGNSLEAHRSVMTSVICFIDSPDDYPYAVSRAIGQGDDVDTLAAMTGALSGARLGIEGIPEYLIECLEDNHQGRSFLIDLSERAHDAISARP